MRKMMRKMILTTLSVFAITAGMLSMSSCALLDRLNLLINSSTGSEETSEEVSEETSEETSEEQEHVHTFGDWVEFTDSDTPCEQKSFFQECATCDSIEWKQGSDEDHDWEIVTTDPTCQEQGYDTKTCSICGKVEIENYKDKLDHVWATEYAYDQAYHWFGCNGCEDVKEKAEHTLDETGECTVCHAIVGSTEGVLYEISEDGTYAKVIGYEGTATKIRIAKTYQNLPVTHISEEAFDNNKTITSVIIPDSVTKMGKSAFGLCSSLTSVVIGNGVTSIGNTTFYGCSSLTSVVIGNGVTSIGDAAFYDCSSLTSVVISNNVTSISYAVFFGCSSLTDVYYKGTEEDWAKLSIGYSNEYLTNATRHYYSEKEPTKEGNYWHYVDGKATKWE